VHNATVMRHTPGPMAFGQQQQPIPPQSLTVAQLEPATHDPPVQLYPDRQSEASAQDVRHDFMSGEHR
jgi:hypothetical protein